MQRRPVDVLVEVVVVGVVVFVDVVVSVVADVAFTVAGAANVVVGTLSNRQTSSQIF